MENLVEENIAKVDENLLESSETLNEETLIEENISEEAETIPESEKTEESEETASTAIIEYREIEEPCVALTIIGENRLSTPAVFVKRGFKYSIKAFFSTLVLTIMNLFI